MNDDFVHSFWTFSNFVCITDIKGIPELEKVCQAFEEEERIKLQKRKQKRQKKKIRQTVKAKKEENSTELPDLMLENAE